MSSQLAMGIFLFLSSVFSCQQPKANFNSVDVEEFSSFIQNDSVQLVDVRTAEEYAERHIVGAININVSSSSFAEEADSQLNKEKPVAVYCRSGKRSKAAARQLSERGFRVTDLNAGFDSWIRAGKKTGAE